MKRSALKFLSWFVFLFAISRPVFAIYWTLVDPSAVPNERREVKPAALNGYFYVAAATAPLTAGIYPTQIYRSADGLSWTLVKNFGGGRLGHIIAHGQNLYAFVDDGLGLAFEVFRSGDGLTWTDVYSGTGFSQYFYYISFGGSLYELDDKTGVAVNVRKTDGLGSSLTWQSVPQGPGTLSLYIMTLTEFQNEVYVMTYSQTGPPPFTYNVSYFKSADLANWTLSTTLVNVNPYPSLAATTSGLYSGLDDIWRLPSSTGSWAIDLTAVPNRPVFPMNIFGNTIAQRTSGANPNGVIDDLLFRSSTGSWTIDSTCQSPGYTGSEPVPVQLTDLAYVPICSSSRLFKNGLISLSRKTFILPTLTFDQKDATVSAMTLTINLDESLTSFVVQNLGSARATTDIKRLQLVRSRFVASVETFATICELTADSDNKTWRMPSGTQVSLQDQDNLYVTADIASFPTSLATVQLAITSMGWTKNTSYSPPLPLVTPQSITINGNPSAPTTISDVLPSPQPASNQVKFFYDLASVADVKIKIFSLTGSLVSEISDPGKAVGRNSTIWDSTKVASGVYYATIEIIEVSGGTRRYRKTVFIKK